MADLTGQISRHLHSVKTIQSIAREAQFLPLIRGVQRWQTLRMQTTHQVQLHDPRTAPALSFFVEQIYGPKDFSQRDADITRVIPKLQKYLPQKALASLESALRLHALSYELDYTLARQLHYFREGITVDIDRQSYILAYASSQNAALRQEQITLLVELGKSLTEAVSIKGISMILALSKHPARLKGLHALHQFLQEGYTAFKKIPDSDIFMRDIVNKEQHLMTQLFAPYGTNPLPYVPSIKIKVEH